MIKLNFSEPASDTWTSWKCDCASAAAITIAAVARGEKAPLTQLYKDARMKSIYVADEAPFFGKCAYCESRIVATQPGDIDHFRPKGRVTHEDGTAALVEDAGGKPVKHPGYYWLAYEWRNLLYTCAACNRPNRSKIDGELVGKWDRFPVEGPRATAPGEEDNELPLLLNPLIDDPEEHLAIAESGVMSALTDRGDACIRILGLNKRQSLVVDRAEAMSNTRNKLSVATMVALASSDTPKTDQLETLVADIRRGAMSFCLARLHVIARCKAQLAPLFSEEGAE